MTNLSKVEYRKYFSREAMGRYTGNSGTNAYAEPALWRIHTIWPWDNHEIVHVYTALVGRPSDFFNEGIAVSLQTDPARGVFRPSFNGVDLHYACRGYLGSNQLPLPVSRYVTTTEFRGISDQVLSYRYAGSFVLYLTERFGLPAVLQFFRTGTRDDTLAVIRTRIIETFGESLDQIEADWIGFLRSWERVRAFSDTLLAGAQPHPFSLRARLLHPATGADTDEAGASNELLRRATFQSGRYL